MQSLQDLFASGAIIDAIIVLVICEAAILFAYRRITGRGIDPVAFLPTLLAGFFLLCALRAALSQAGWTWLALFLLASLVAHLFDLAGRRRT